MSSDLCKALVAWRTKSSISGTLKQCWEASATLLNAEKNLLIRLMFPPVAVIESRPLQSLGAPVERCLWVWVGLQAAPDGSQFAAEASSCALYQVRTLGFRVLVLRPGATDGSHCCCCCSCRLLLRPPVGLLMSIGHFECIKRQLLIASDKPRKKWKHSVQGFLSMPGPISRPSRAKPPRVNFGRGERYSLFT